MMLYDGRDRVVALFPKDTANLADVLLSLHESDNDTVALSQLTNRPCIGIALFSTKEWSALLAGGRQPSEVRPSEATTRYRVYPATQNARVTVENIEQRIAYVSIGLEFARNPLAWAKTRADSARTAETRWMKDGRHALWSVLAQLDSARGRCSVE